MNVHQALRRAALAFATLAVLTRAGVACADARLPLAGVNIAGSEFGAPPGVHEKDYHYPSDAEFAFARAKGFQVVRLPFLWERLQPVLEQDLDKTELERLSAAVDRAHAKNLAIILDVHNYGRWRGEMIGSDKVSNRAFADFWRRLAKVFSGRKDVIFGLMNEPHGISPDGWAASAQAALSAVRAAGACNLTLVPGTNWTGAHSWNAAIEGSSNATAMAKLRDAGAHAIEFHQYLDEDWSGMHPTCRKPEEAVAALSKATDWLRASKQKGFLGEFGAGPDAQCRAGLDAMLGHMKDNADVWIGWAYWAAGAWWPATYPLSIQPVDGKDRPQMETLSKWIGPAQNAPGCDASIGRGGRRRK